MKFLVNGHNIFLIVLVCFFASLLFVEIMRKVALFLGIMDIPNEKRKIQKEPVPLLGGLGIFLAFLLGYMLFAPKDDSLILSVLIGSFLIMLLGLFDDMTKCKTPMPNKYKVIVQLIVAAIVVFYGGLKLSKVTIFGLNISFTGIPVFPEILTMIIIVGTINAINLIDGLDGLCAGISSIYFLTIAVIGFVLNKFGGLDIILSLIMLGSTLGYLVHNFPPAKIYQGDAGSTFLGFIISVIFLLGFKTTTLSSLIIPMLILAIPIMDTLFAIIRRKLKGQRIDQADKEHLHHQLLKNTHSTKITVLIMYAINILFATVSIFYTLGDKKISICLYAILLLFFVILVLKTDILFDHHRGNDDKN